VGRGLVAVTVSVAVSVSGATAALASDDLGPPAPPQDIVPGVVIRKAPEPEPQRDPLADAVEAQAQKQKKRRPAPPTEMDVRMVHANILSRMGAGAFVADLREATAGAPDFVTLNEAVRPPELLTLPDYAFHRGSDSRWTLETTVMWRTDRWEALSTGTRYLHQRGGTWGTRAVNWVTLESLETGKVVSVVSTHASPVGKGTPDLLPLYMSGLSALVRELSAQGPVFAGGDLNAHYGSGRFPRAGLSAGGLATTYDVHGMPPGGTGDHFGSTIDYLMYQPASGVTSTSQWKTELLSDHDAVAGDFHLEW
jgi:endonuclease/exonuclease/phosphatase (EEP) superfamily protein YafD